MSHNYGTNIHETVFVFVVFHFPDTNVATRSQPTTSENKSTTRLELLSKTQTATAEWSRAETTTPSPPPSTAEASAQTAARF